MHQDFNEETHLDDETIKTIKKIVKILNKIAKNMTRPMDSKAIALIEMAADLLDEQVELDKIYEYPDCMQCPDTQTYEKPDMLFFKDDSAPSAEELNQMFDMDWEDDQT